MESGLLETFQARHACCLIWTRSQSRISRDITVTMDADEEDLNDERDEILSAASEGGDDHDSDDDVEKELEKVVLAVTETLGLIKKGLPEFAKSTRRARHGAHHHRAGGHRRGS